MVRSAPEPPFVLRPQGRPRERGRNLSTGSEQRQRDPAARSCTEGRVHRTWIHAIVARTDIHGRPWTSHDEGFVHLFDQEESVKRRVMLVAVALFMVACAKAKTTSGPTPTDSASSSPSPTATATTPVETTRATIYYLVSYRNKTYLAPERHTVAKTETAARTALDALVHGTAQDPDHTTPFPRTATINSVTIANKVATVDWSAEVLNATVGAQVEALGIQSAVYTLTGFPTIAKVRFTVEGKDHGAASNGRAIEDWWGHVGLTGQPWDREPALDVLEPITLFSPLDRASSAGTLRLVGEATVFEATVGIVLRDTTGKTMMKTFATASKGAPGRGAFTKTITFTPPATVENWTLEVVEESAEDGSVVFLENRTIVVG
jgi:germination protein M